MIPRIIHYCWFGREPIPELETRCIESWKRILPEYELRLWNEDNFDLSCNRFVKEAYFQEKYAFVADYVRLFALYNWGGVYLDTDVEVLRPLNSFLVYPAFSGFEIYDLITTGIIGAEKGSSWVKREMDYYDNQSFICPNGALNTKPNIKIITEHALKNGLIQNNQFQIVNDELAVFPREYFSPKSYVDGIINITDNSYVIHHYTGSWQKKSFFQSTLINVFGDIWGSRIWKLNNLIRKTVKRI